MEDGFFVSSFNVLINFFRGFAQAKEIANRRRRCGKNLAVTQSISQRPNAPPLRERDISHTNAPQFQRTFTPSFAGSSALPTSSRASHSVTPSTTSDSVTPTSPTSGSRNTNISTNSPGNQLSRPVVVALAVSLGWLVLGIIVFCIFRWCTYKKRQRDSQRSPGNASHQTTELLNQPSEVYEMHANTSGNAFRELDSRQTRPHRNELHGSAGIFRSELPSNVSTSSSIVPTKAWQGPRYLQFLNRTPK